MIEQKGQNYKKFLLKNPSSATKEDFDEFVLSVLEKRAEIYQKSEKKPS